MRVWDERYGKNRAGQEEWDERRKVERFEMRGLKSTAKTSLLDRLYQTLRRHS